MTARCFFACGLDCAWDERTRPVREWERAIFRPTLFPADTGMSAEWKKASSVSLGAFFRIRRDRAFGGKPRSLHPA
ncbi:hypothetical protein NBRC116589_02740 [Ruegeria sp. HU-ET01832]